MITPIILEFRLIDKRSNTITQLNKYEKAWKYRYDLNIWSNTIHINKIKKFNKVLVLYAPKYIQLQIKENNRYISYNSK